MNTAKKIAHNSLIQIVGKIISVATAIGSIAILTRYLGPEQFGWYTTTVAFLQIFGILADFGLVLITSQMLAQHESKQSLILNNLFTFRLISAFILIGIAPLTVLLFPYPPIIKQAVALTSLMFFSISLQQIFTGLFQKQLKMQFATVAEIASRLILIAGIALVAWFNLGFFSALVAMIIANIAQLVILWIYSTSFHHIKLAFDPTIWREIIIKSYPIALSIIFNMIYLRADILILSFTHSQIDVGLYGAAYKILDVITQLPILFMGLMVPLMTIAWTKHNNKELHVMIEKSLHAFIVVGTPIIIGGMILAKPIMRLIAGDQFTQAGMIAQILFLALIGGFLGALFGHIIVAINKQKQAIKIYATVALVGIIGYILIIPIYGTIGAAWITVLTELTAGTLLFLFTKIHIPLKISWIKVLMKTLLACLTMLLPIIFLPQLHIIVQILLAMIIYAITTWYLRTIPHDELKSLCT